MKKLLLISMFLQMAGLSILNAQVTDPNLGANDNKVVRLEEIKKATEVQLNKLLEITDKRNYPAFALNMVYSGPDAKRNMRSPLNFDDPFERLTAENNLNRIRSWMEKAAIYHLSNFHSVPGITGELYTWDVEFASMRGKVKNHQFTFLLSNGKYMLFTAE